MATTYYRMSSVRRAEAALRRLEAEPGLVPSRPLGYAYLRVVRVDHPDELNPDAVVSEIDVMARRVPDPTGRIGVCDG
jgi:hypothetical protein